MVHVVYRALTCLVLILFTLCWLRLVERWAVVMLVLFVIKRPVVMVVLTTQQRGILAASKEIRQMFVVGTAAQLIM